MKESLNVSDIYTLDLESKISYWRMPEERRKEIRDDGVHFTEKRYDLMREIVAGRLIKVISEIDGVEQTLRRPVRSDLKIREKTSEPRYMVRKGS